MQRSLFLVILAAALLAGCVTPTVPAPAPPATQAAQPQPPPPTTAAQVERAPMPTAVTRPAAALASPTVLPLATAPAVVVARTTPPATGVVPLTASPAVSTVAPTKTPAPAPGLITVPTPQPPVDPAHPGTKYVLQEEQVTGAYVIRMWHDPVLDLAVGLDVTTISVVGRPQVVITGTSAIGLLNGQDLTGEGVPDIVIEKYSGGAHCCFGTVVYRAGPILTKILDLESGNCAGNFQDLDKNGTFEFVTCDDSFAYTYCSYAASPKVKVIYEYKAGQGYQPRSPSWAEQYAQDIAEDTKMAQASQPGGMTEWDNTNKCAVLPLTLDYLYSGQAAKAWDALKAYYKGPDLAAFQAEIDATVRKSPMFVTP